jgi:hypothetical protein
LQGSADIPNDAAGTHDDATDQPNMPRNTVTIETESRRAQKRFLHPINGLSARREACDGFRKDRHQ